LIKISSTEDFCHHILLLVAVSIISHYFLSSHIRLLSWTNQPEPWGVWSTSGKIRYDSSGKCSLSV